MYVIQWFSVCLIFISKTSCLEAVHTIDNLVFCLKWQPKKTFFDIQINSLMYVKKLHIDFLYMSNSEYFATRRY